MVRTVPKHFACRLRRGRRLPPLMVPEKITLAEANRLRLEINADILVPEDLQQLCQHNMGEIDSFPQEVREACQNASWTSCVQLAAKLLRQGRPVPFIVSQINIANDQITANMRAKGVLPPPAGDTP